MPSPTAQAPSSSGLTPAQMYNSSPLASVSNPQQRSSSYPGPPQQGMSCLHYSEVLVALKCRSEKRTNQAINADPGINPYVPQSTSPYESALSIPPFVRRQESTDSFDTRSMVSSLAPSYRSTRAPSYRRPVPSAAPAYTRSPSDASDPTLAPRRLISFGPRRWCDAPS